jgi:hypothetical protein
MAPPDLFDFVRVVIGALLIIAGAIKSTHLGDFAKTLTKGKLAPRRLVPFVAIIVPPLEVALGLAMVLELWLALAAGATATLFAAFAIAVSTSLQRVPHAGECGCLGRGGRLSHGVSVRNIGLALLTVSVGISRSPMLLIVGAVFVVVGSVWARERKNVQAVESSGRRGLPQLTH